jgi:hypothetical protein
LVEFVELLEFIGFMESVELLGFVELIGLVGMPRLPRMSVEGLTMTGKNTACDGKEECNAGLFAPG